MYHLHPCHSHQQLSEYLFNLHYPNILYLPSGAFCHTENVYLHHIFHLDKPGNSVSCIQNHQFQWQTHISPALNLQPDISDQLDLLRSLYSNFFSIILAQSNNNEQCHPLKCELLFQILVSFIRDAHSKDFQPIFNWFSLQFLFNFTTNLTFFAVKMNKNWIKNWSKISYCECQGSEILEKQAELDQKQNHWVFSSLAWMELCPIIYTQLSFPPPTGYLTAPRLEIARGH